MEFPLGQPQGYTIQGPSCIYGIQETYISFPSGFKNKVLHKNTQLPHCVSHHFKAPYLAVSAAKDVSNEEGSLLFPLMYLLRHCHLWSTEEFCMCEVLSAGLCDFWQYTVVDWSFHRFISQKKIKDYINLFSNKLIHFLKRNERYLN